MTKPHCSAFKYTFWSTAYRHLYHTLLSQPSLVIWIISWNYWLLSLFLSFPLSYMFSTLELDNYVNLSQIGDPLSWTLFRGLLIHGNKRRSPNSASNNLVSSSSLTLSPMTYFKSKNLCNCSFKRLGIKQHWPQNVELASPRILSQKSASLASLFILVSASMPPPQKE